MTKKTTPIDNVPTSHICADCQSEALEHIAAQKVGLGATLAYCPDTRRALFLRSYDGEIEVKEVSPPGEADELQKQFQEYFASWLRAALGAQAQRERDTHGGTLH